MNRTELLFSYISMSFSMRLTHGVALQGLFLSTLAINVTLLIIDKFQKVVWKIFDTIILDKQ